MKKKNRKYSADFWHRKWLSELCYIWPSIPNGTKYLEPFFGHFHKPFGLAYLPLNSATINCSSEVTLKAMHKTIAMYGHGGVALFQPLSLLQKYFSVVPKYLGEVSLLRKFRIGNGNQISIRNSNFTKLFWRKAHNIHEKYFHANFCLNSGLNPNWHETGQIYLITIF